MALSANALITLAEAKSHIGIEPLNTTFDSKIEGIVNAASSMISNYTKRKLVTDTYTEFLDGSGANKIILHQWPVNSVANLWIDAESIFDATSLVPTSDWALENSITILYKDRTFPRGYRNIKVEYTAGYGTAVGDNLPHDLRYSCAELVDWLYNVNSNHRIGITSKGKLGESVSFEQRLPQHIELMLEPYIRYEFANANTQVLNR